MLSMQILNVKENDLVDGNSATSIIAIYPHSPYPLELIKILGG